MLGLLLSISIVGQQLPCVHAVAPLAETSASASTTASHTVIAHSAIDHAAMHHGPQSVTVTPADAPEQRPSAPASAPHHDPAAPGCAQLMACGLAVQVTIANTLAVADLAPSTAAPHGEYLQFSTADLEVESPPPKG